MKTPIGIITEDVTKSHALAAFLLYSECGHVLIAGTTGSGKSVMLNSTIYSAARGKGEFYFIDLKRVELAKWKRLAACSGFCSEPEQVLGLLDNVINRMEARYKHMKGPKYDGEYIYLFIDELADLVTQKGVLERLVKIGRLGRAAKIRMICATQDPSRRTLPAALMQNFGNCLALRCRSSIESRQIIGIPGAETLPLYGKGILWNAYGTHIFDIPMTPDEDIEKVISAFSRRPLLLNLVYALVARSTRPYLDHEYAAKMKRGEADWADMRSVYELCTEF